MEEITEFKEKVEEGAQEPEAEPIEEQAEAQPVEPEPEAQAEGEGQAEGIEPEPEEGPVEEESAQEAPLEGNPTSENGDGIAPEPEKPIFTQEQVNKMAGKSREEGRKAGYKAGYDAAMAEMLEKYGVENGDELDGLFADGSRYGEQMARYDDMGRRLKDSETTVALMKCGILPDRYSDVKAILGANGMEVTEEAIQSMLPTHKEWIAEPQAGQQAAPAPEIPQPKPEGIQPKGESAGVMGAEPKSAAGPESGETEEEQAMRVFGIKK